jgi:hypothetical protein
LNLEFVAAENAGGRSVPCAEGTRGRTAAPNASQKASAIYIGYVLSLLGTKERFSFVDFAMRVCSLRHTIALHR